MVQKSTNVHFLFFLCQKMAICSRDGETDPCHYNLNKTLLLLQYILKCSEHLEVTWERPRCWHRAYSWLKHLPTSMSQWVMVGSHGLHLPGYSYLFIFLYSRLVAYMEIMTSSLLLMQCRWQLLPQLSILCIGPVWLSCKTSHIRLINDGIWFTCLSEITARKKIAYFADVKLS